MTAWSLEGMTVLVTGAGRGIGAAIVAECLRHGASVLGTARTQSGLDNLRFSHPDAMHRLKTFQADITQPGERERLVEFAKGSFGGLDVLVNNAGETLRASAVNSSTAEFQRLIDLNVLAAFDLARLVYPLFKANNRGSIVNLSSVASQVALPNRVLYGASKAALDHLTRSLAAEWGADGIRVNAVLPWFTRTPMTVTVLEDPELSARILQATPLGRVAGPEDIARVIAFLAMPAAGYVTGQLLAVDGGFLARGL
jgi:tropinone reductase I